MPRSRPPSALHLTSLTDDSASGLCTAIVFELAQGRLRDGDLLPSSRALAEELSLPRARIVEAYTQLAAAGFVVTTAGSGTRIDRGAVAAAKGGATAVFTLTEQAHPSSVSPSPKVQFDLRPGFPDVNLINERDWKRCWKRAVTAELSSLGTATPQENLQRALADHLRVSRGVTAAPSDILIFNGIPSAIRTIARTAATAGRTLTHEDPGYDKGRRAFGQSGVTIRPVPIDESGLCVHQLTADDWGAYVTPAHQYPLGVRMPATRRQQLLSWAVRTNALIFEDDYDGEFRYDVASIPPLRTMTAGADHVVYLGTASKILSRELRIAWAIVPHELHDAVQEQQRLDGEPVSAIAAAALTELITSGALLRHLAAAHRTYAARRHRFAQAWQRIMPEARVHGIDAGLHLVVTFESGFDDHAAVRALAEVGVLCSPLSSYAVAADTSGLVCGYALLPETKATTAVTAIKNVLGKAGRSATTRPARLARRTQPG